MSVLSSMNVWRVAWEPGIRVVVKINDSDLSHQIVRVCSHLPTQNPQPIQTREVITNDFKDNNT